MGVTLVGQTGGHHGREVAIDTPEFMIGRDPACQLQIDLANVSRIHCRFVRDGGRVWIEDLGSNLGTEINGRAIRSVEVKDGDELRIGSERFLISVKTNGVAMNAPKDLVPAPALPDTPEHSLAGELPD